MSDQDIELIKSILVSDLRSEDWIKSNNALNMLNDMCEMNKITHDDFNQTLKDIVSNKEGDFSQHTRSMVTKLAVNRRLSGKMPQNEMEELVETYKSFTVLRQSSFRI